MKTFSQFMTEAYDAEVMSRSQIRKTGEGGRIGAERKKSAPERRRMKAVGGGKMEPAASYKPRKDIGTQRKAETRTQQPEKERGSAEVKQTYAQKAKEERRKAAQARIAAKKSGGTVATAKPKAKEAEKKATELLSKKKAASAPAPGYKAPKASGLSRKERTAVRKKGKALLRDLVLQATGKKKEKELKHSYTGPEKE